MTKQQKLQRDITFAQNRLNVKIAFLPKLEANVTDETMKQKYMDGIEHEKTLIAKWTAQLGR